MGERTAIVRAARLYEIKPMGDLFAGQAILCVCVSSIYAYAGSIAFALCVHAHACYMSRVYIHVYSVCMCELGLMLKSQYLYETKTAVFWPYVLWCSM